MNQVCRTRVLRILLQQMQIRSFCSSRWFLSSALDPGYFGLFQPQPQRSSEHQESKQRQPQPDDGNSDERIRHQLSMVFRPIIKEWAHTVHPEFICHSIQNRRRQNAVGDDGDDDYEEDDYVEDDDREDDDDKAADDDTDGLRYEFEDESDVDDVEKLEIEDSDDHDREDQTDLETDEGSKPDKSNEDVNSTGNLGDPEYQDYELDESLYYYTSSGKLKYRRLEIHAPKDEIYEKLSEAGIISAKRKRPLAVPKLAKKSDAEIVGWYYYCSIELLQYFRICHNLNEVKAIVEYHLRWSAIQTLAKKYKCNARQIVSKYGRDLECLDKKGNKVRLMTREEIKQVSRGVNKRVQITHRYRALRILQEMD